MTNSPHSISRHRQRLLVIGALCLLNAFSLSAFADDLDSSKVYSPFSQDVTLRRVQLMVSPDYTTISRGGFSASGATLGAAAQFAMDDFWGLGGQFRQSFDTGNLSPLFTGLDLFAVFALTGTLAPKERRISSYDQPVLSFKQVSEGGVRGRFYLTRYFFNASTSLASFLGVGASLAYQFPSNTDFNYSVGLRTGSHWKFRCDAHAYPVFHQFWIPVALINYPPLPALFF